VKEKKKMRKKLISIFNNLRKKWEKKRTLQIKTNEINYSFSYILINEKLNVIFIF